MKLTSYSNYALRILMVAAARSPQLTTIQEVADGFGISKAHLVKCVHNLGNWGYLQTVRGHKGGFCLAMPPEHIRVGAVIRHTEEGFTLVECFNPETNTCPMIGNCLLSLAFRKATDAFLQVLDQMTLADICTNSAQVLAILHLDERPTAATGEHADTCSSLIL